jgi:hypothetical protein
MGRVSHYADAVYAEQGRCWRVVNNDGQRQGMPTHCPEDGSWFGTDMVGGRRLQFWSCDGHMDDLADPRSFRSPRGGS